jgi:Putative Ig domain
MQSPRLQSSWESRERLRKYRVEDLMSASRRLVLVIVLSAVGTTMTSLASAAPQLLTALNLLPNGRAGERYPHIRLLGGGRPPYTFTVLQGRQPPGTRFTSDGYLIGTPTVPGNYTFTVESHDATTPPQVVRQRYSVRIEARARAASQQTPR